MLRGEHFKIPETEADALALWNLADPLDKNSTPDWITEDEDNDPLDFRILGNTTWAYISSDEQKAYFEEIDLLYENEWVVVDSDDGDGCVHHFFIKRPDSAVRACPCCGKDECGQAWKDALEGAK